MSDEKIGIVVDLSINKAAAHLKKQLSVTCSIQSALSPSVALPLLTKSSHLTLSMPLIERQIRQLSPQLRQVSEALAKLNQTLKDSCQSIPESSGVEQGLFHHLHLLQKSRSTGDVSAISKLPASFDLAKDARSSDSEPGRHHTASVLNQTTQKEQTVSERLSHMRDRVQSLKGIYSDLKNTTDQIKPLAQAAMLNEKSFASVTRAVHMNGSQAQQLRLWALQRATHSTSSASDINQALAIGGQSGIHTIDKLKVFASDANKIGGALGQSAPQAARQMLSWQQVFALKPQGAAGLSGLAVELGQAQHVDATAIAKVISQQHRARDAAGFDARPTAALASTLLSHGMNQSQVVLSVNRIADRLTQGHFASQQEKLAFHQLGFSDSQIARQMQHNASATLSRIAQAIGQAPQVSQPALVHALFTEKGDSSAVQSSMQQALDALISHPQSLHQALAISNQSAPHFERALNQSYQGHLGGASNQMLMFEHSLYRLKVALGDTLLPAMNNALPVLTKMVNGAASLIENHQGMAKAIIALVSGFKLLSAGLKVFRETKGLFSDISGIVKAVRRLFGRGNAADESFSSTDSYDDVRSRRSRWVHRSLTGKMSQWLSRLSHNRLFRKTGHFLQPPLHSQGVTLLGRGIALLAANRFAEKSAAKRMPVQDPTSHSPAPIGENHHAMIPGWMHDGVGLGADLAESAGKKGLGKFLKPLGFGMDALNAVQGIRNHQYKKVGKSLGDAGGVLAGGEAGAAIGTMLFPGIGTLIGGFLGSVAGGIGGSELGGWLGQHFSSSHKTAAKHESDSLHSDRLEHHTTPHPLIQSWMHDGVKLGADLAQATKKIRLSRSFKALNLGVDAFNVVQGIRNDPHSKVKPGLNHSIVGELTTPPDQTKHGLIPNWIHSVVDWGADLADFAGKKSWSKLFKPLNLGLHTFDFVQGVRNHQYGKAGQGLGGAVGLMTGEYLGGMLGTAVFPGVGTVIGELLGGLAGGTGGSALGGWFGRRLDSPEQTAAKVASVHAKEAQARQQPPIHFAPVFTINAQPQQKPAEIAQQVALHMDRQYQLLMGGNTISTQLSYSAIDSDH